MLEIFFGTDTPKVRAAALDRIATLTQSGAALETIDADQFQPGLLAEVAGATSLFAGETIYLLDTPSSTKEFTEAVQEHVALLAESPNQFVVIEGTLLAAEKKWWQKYATSLEEYKADAAERFNTFAVADALAQKDKKSLWLLLQQARASGQSAEEIIGVLWWQLKTLQLAAKTSTARAAGLKDFPYNKAKRSLRNFKTGEIEALSLGLLAVYHDGHSGRVDIDEALERWLLRV